MKTVKQFLAISLFIIVTSCSKDSDAAIAPVADSNLQIASISPVAGPKNTIVTIVGKGFSDIVANNSVTLNSTNCPIINSTNTQLTVKILPSSGSGKLKVTVNNAVAESNNFDFIVTITAKIIAGSTSGFNNGSGSKAQFRNPAGIAVDAEGNLFVADIFNEKIRKITPNGNVSTFAGSTFGFADGVSNVAMFKRPFDVTIDPIGNLYVTDFFNHKIRKISSTGLVSTFAGNIEGYLDGIGTSALFNLPNNITIDKQGTLFITDSENRRIRKITSTGVVTTFAGSGASVAADGQGMAASFSSLRGITVDQTGNLFVVDDNGAKIRKISPTGLVTTIAGSTLTGFADGQGTAAKFNAIGISSDLQGNLYVADDINNCIRKITPEGLVSTIVGRNSNVSFKDENNEIVQSFPPNGIVVDNKGNIYVTSGNDNKIGKITFD